MPAHSSTGQLAAQHTAGLLIRLRGVRPTLAPAEARVADRVLADPRSAASLTISELATVAETSETTVLRFCRRLGLRGYPNLRLALAEESAQSRSRPAREGDIHAGDSVDDVIAKVAHADAGAVEETASQLDRSALAAAASAINGASRVDIFGIGASWLVGTDLQQKLHRIGIIAMVNNDPHLGLTSAVLLGKRDVAIGISHSGTTGETNEYLERAAERGATTIAITNCPTSALARTADILLTTASTETDLRSGATASRIAALTVIDCLYIVVAQRDLRRAKRAIKVTRTAVEGRHRR